MDLRRFLAASRALEGRVGPHEHDVDARTLAGLSQINSLSPLHGMRFPSDEQS
jgi:hypothetical protein